MSRTVDVVGVGMVTVDYLFRVGQRPSFGGSQRASAYARACGGPVPTALACLARLGASTRFVGRVGDDDEGRFLRAELARHGVDTTGLRSVPGRSRVALVLVDEASGERGFVSSPESHPPLTSGDFDPSDLAGARVVHIDDADDAGLQAALWGRQAGATVVFDGTWQSDHLAAFLPCVDYAVVSEFFARRWLPDADDEQILQRLVTLGAGAAVLTLGARGCVALADDAIQRCPAATASVVDTTGAGDAFHGGFIFGLLQDWPLERTLPFAAATAALNCRALGGQIGLPTLEEVAQMLRTPV